MKQKKETVDSLRAKFRTSGISVDLDSSDVPALIQCLEAPEWDIRLCAILVLSRLGPAAVEAVPSLIRFFDEGRLRQSAALALGRIGDPAAVPILISALRDPDSLTRRYAAEALGRIGAPAIEAFPFLFESLSDSDENVRRHAVAALRNVVIS